jgi:hypothetical protein
MIKKAIVLEVDGQDAVVECRNTPLNTERLKKLEPMFTMDKLLLPTMNHLRMLAAIDIWTEYEGCGSERSGSWPSMKFCNYLWNEVFDAKFAPSMYTRVKSDLIHEFGLAQPKLEAVTWEPTHLIEGEFPDPEIAKKYVTQAGERRRAYELYNFHFK